MTVSTPLFQLKRRARLIARENKLPLHAALDRVAQERGFARWSLLSARSGAAPLDDRIFAQIENGDLLLIAGRPGQGKTMLALQLLIKAAQRRCRSLLFTLDLIEQQARQKIADLDTMKSGVVDKVEIITSDDIDADYIIDHVAGSAPGTLVVIDYLQLLDQQRRKPPLEEQVSALSRLARESGIRFAFLSQIDRSFETQEKPVPDLNDIRLPNQLDLRSFTKACFLHRGQVQLCQIG